MILGSFTRVAAVPRALCGSNLATCHNRIEPKGTHFASFLPARSRRKAMNASTHIGRKAAVKLVLLAGLGTTLLAGMGYASLGLMTPVLDRLDKVNQQLGETNEHLVVVNRKLDSMMDELNSVNDQLTA